MGDFHVKDQGLAFDKSAHEEVSLNSAAIEQACTFCTTSSTNFPLHQNSNIMKHITICLILLFLSTISLSQQAMPDQAFTKQDYKQKSEHQGKTALVLAGGGLVLEIAGIIAYKYGNASFLLFGAGLISQIVSLPFFISALINDHKSKKASLSFTLQKSPDIHPSLINYRAHPEISLNLNF